MHLLGLALGAYILWGPCLTSSECEVHGDALRPSHTEAAPLPVARYETVYRHYQRGCDAPDPATMEATLQRLAQAEVQGEPTAEQRRLQRLPTGMRACIKAIRAAHDLNAALAAQRGRGAQP